ncbi:MAG: hypothetical protein AABZ60_08790 [Planctomycetota bacterium]
MSFIDRWKIFANKLGKINTFILMTVLYFTVIMLFSLIRFTDPLRKKLSKSRDSYWEEYRQREFKLENYYRLS